MPDETLYSLGLTHTELLIVCAELSDAVEKGGDREYVAARDKVRSMVLAINAAKHQQSAARVVPIWRGRFIAAREAASGVGGSDHG